MPKFPSLSAVLLSLIPATAIAQDEDAAKRGEILAAIAGCAHCHTAPEGADYAGGRVLLTPFGKIATPNITPDKTGIGDWSRDDFDAALRRGKRPNGLPLYPAMPYPSYTKMTDQDLDDLWAYVSSLSPQDNSVEVLLLPFPYNLRPSVLAWQELFFTEGRFQPVPEQSGLYNRGAYLTEALAHCGSCHTPRNALGGQIAERRFEGASIGTAYAPDISLNPGSALEKYDEDSLTAFLRDAPTNNIPAFSEMHMVSHDLALADPEDVRAIAHYILNSQTPDPDATAPDLQPLSDAAFERGKSLYASNCESCHRDTGMGDEGVAATLVNNGGVTAQSPINAVTIVLHGMSPNGDYGPMPAFGNKLSDAEIADIVNYIRRDWGNKGPRVATANYVANIRQFPVEDTAQTLGRFCRTLSADLVSDGLRQDLAGLATGTPPTRAALQQVIDAHADEIDAMSPETRHIALSETYCLAHAKAQPNLPGPVFTEEKIAFIETLDRVLK